MSANLAVPCTLMEYHLLLPEVVHPIRLRSSATACLSPKGLSGGDVIVAEKVAYHICVAHSTFAFLITYSQGLYHVCISLNVFARPIADFLS